MMNVKTIRVGFWCDTRGVLQSLVDKLDGLPDPRTLVDAKWPLADRVLIAAYLNAAPAVEHWMGYSYCRFGCPDDVDMGTSDKSDGTYLWPEGLSHYILKHSVLLPVEFIRHIHRAVANLPGRR